MIELTPSLITTRPGAPAFAMDAGGGPDFAVLVPGLAGAGAPDFARAFAGVVAAAGGDIAGPVSPIGTVTAGSGQAPTARQILAVPGSALPDGAGPTNVAGAPIVGGAAQASDIISIPGPPLNDTSPVLAAKDEHELSEPQLEPALAWLLPPPPPAALPVAVIAAATVQPRTKLSAVLDELTAPVQSKPVDQVQSMGPDTGKGPVVTPDGVGKIPIQRSLIPEPIVPAAPPAGKLPVSRPLDGVGKTPISRSPQLGVQDTPPIDSVQVSGPLDGVGKVPIQRSLTPAAGLTSDAVAPPAPRPAGLRAADTPLVAGTDRSVTGSPLVPVALPGAAPVRSVNPAASGRSVNSTTKSGPAPVTAKTPVAPVFDGRETDVAPIRAATRVAPAAAGIAAVAPTRRNDDGLSPTQLTPASAAVQQPLAVAATGGAQHAGIDLTREPGLHRMIDRIETLRDAAVDGARETRIRLIPDALGPVDVSVRREGEAVHVHFTASEAATRQLIADAQPRLADLAEARGVRIDRATVDGGATGQPHGQQGQSAPHSDRQPGQPARANRLAMPAESFADPDPNSNQRIA